MAGGGDRELSGRLLNTAGGPAILYPHYFLLVSSSSTQHPLSERDQSSQSGVAVGKPTGIMSSQTGLASSSTMDNCGDSAESSSKPRQRSSKACEGCRARRIKCIGGVPCDACTAIGIGADCEVRAKARPKRCVENRKVCHMPY
jgi:hypothetical protein